MQKSTKKTAFKKSVKLSQPESKPVVPPKIESTPIKAWKNEQNELKYVIAPDLTGANALKQLIGTGDTDIAACIMQSGASALSSLVVSNDAFNIIAQSLRDFQPRDVMEARLVTQAATLFQHGMRLLSKAGSAEYMDCAEAYSNAAIKMLRLHNESVEALARYRRGGEQKVTVTHAVIANQAVVNNFPPGEGGSHKNEGDTP